MRVLTHCLTGLTMLATTATAQVRLPSIPLPVQGLGVTRPLDEVESQSLDRLSDLRQLTIERLIRDNPRLIDEDPNGEPVVRHEILGLSPTEAALDLPAGRYTGDWVNVRTGSIERAETFEHPGGGKVLQTPEFQNGIALRLKRAGP